jgi:hypothetical protein
MTKPMIEGSCHCGSVRFVIPEAPQIVTDCNCSMCRRLGALWAYFEEPQVSLDAVPDATIPYIQGDRMLATHHCRTCGCTTFWKSLQASSQRMGVNARLLHPSVLAGATIRRLDGADTWAVLEEIPPGGSTRRSAPASPHSL